MTDHLAVARALATTALAPRFDPVQRWYQRVAVADDHEAWLLTWLPGQGTDLHDHGGSAGAFLVVAGTLTEDTVTGTDRPRATSRDLGEGAGRRFGARHVHRIVNRSAVPAVSIHVYGPALTSMTHYRITPAGLETLTVAKAGAQW